MGRQHPGRRAAAALLVAAWACACATSPLGRSQLKMMPREQVDQAGEMAFSAILQQKPLSRDVDVNVYVLCVTRAITSQLSGPAARVKWQVAVFDDLSPNAFALPSGKIGVNRGMLRVARNQDQLGAVLGHEVSHVVAEHANERLSAESATGSVIALGANAAGGVHPGFGQAVGLLGTGAQIGVLLPYARSHEREADLLGLDLMARAGFDPSQAIVLWANMAKVSQAKPPEFLSTHPGDAERMEELRERLSKSSAIYRNALARGRRPHCM